MAILTVSRQIASLGDELCKSIADNLGYRFVTRKEIEQRILSAGFPESKLRKFDERKPGFLSSLTNDRDEYLDYLQTAIYEAAADDNCVIIGRGSFIILKDLPNHISLKFIADKKLRIERYQNEHKCSEKQALKIINESDTNRDGFNKSFFDFDRNDPAMFHMIINTGLLELNAISKAIETLVRNTETSEKTDASKKLLNEYLLGQKIVNLLKYKNDLEIRFLRTNIEADEIILHGVADTKIISQNAAKIVSEKFPEYKVISKITSE